MRGLICLVVAVWGPLKGLHSGTHGGTFNEPLNDLVTVLSSLVDSNNIILIPGKTYTAAQSASAQGCAAQPM